MQVINRSVFPSVVETRAQRHLLAQPCPRFLGFPKSYVAANVGATSPGVWSWNSTATSSKLPIITWVSKSLSLLVSIVWKKKNLSRLVLAQQA